MHVALAEAHAALSEAEVPVGAVIVRDGTLLARAHNRREQLPDPTAHAEILALRDAAKAVGNWRLPGSTLYVTLEPCPMCAAAIVQARVERVVYGADDPRLGAAGSRFHVFAEQQEHRVDVIGGICENACSELLQAFFRDRRPGR